MIGRHIPLGETARVGGGPSEPGVYILHLRGRVMKVGSAEIGIQKRMQQYYSGNPWCGLNHCITEHNREQVTVTYQCCPAAACRELESKLFDKYGPVTVLPWAQRRPHCSDNKYVLQI